MRTDAKTKRLAFDAAFVCLALALSYLESFLPPFVFPGAKLGLTNIALTVCAYRYFVTDAAAVSFCRILISFLLFGNVTSLLFSIFGSALSLLTLAVLKKHNLGLSFIGISVLCARFHIMQDSSQPHILPQEGQCFRMLPCLCSHRLYSVRCADSSSR